MFALNQENKQKLHTYIDKFAFEVSQKGHYTDDFGFIFDTIQFFENGDFGFIFEVISLIKDYINVNNLDIGKISVLYDLDLPLICKRPNIFAVSEKDLLYFIQDFPYSKERLTPPKLTLQSRNQTELQKNGKTVYIPANWYDYNIQNVRKEFFSNYLEGVATTLITHNDSPEDSAYSSTLWFETYC